MLAPAYIVSVADGVVEIYSQVEQDIAADIARRIVKTGYMTTRQSGSSKKHRSLAISARMLISSSQKPLVCLQKKSDG